MARPTPPRATSTLAVSRLGRPSISTITPQVRTAHALHMARPSRRAAPSMVRTQTHSGNHVHRQMKDPPQLRSFRKTGGCGCGGAR